MTSRPILFSAPMVRAILDGSKSQTRRIVKPQPFTGTLTEGESWTTEHAFKNDRARYTLSPYGQPGDQLWVRETWGSLDADHTAACKSEGYRKPSDGDRVVYRADPASDYQWGSGKSSQGSFMWRPSIHMPRWASRIALEITGIRVERLQDISESDAESEGITWHRCGCQDGCARCDDRTPKEVFRSLWESINGPGSWDANPFVWVVEFRRL